MKRGLLTLLFLAILAGYGHALTTTLSDPTNSQTITATNSIIFKCNVDENVSSLKLYHNLNGWKENQTNASAVVPNSSYSFTVINNVADGVYAWNCLANESTFAIANFTFTMDFIQNKAPFYSTIPEIKWVEDKVNNSLNLSSYFTDPDGNSLTYYSSGNINVKFSIDNSTGKVTITPNGNYTGSFTATFTASDGSLSNTSNSILFNVTPVNDAPFLIKEIPNQTWTYGNVLTLDMAEYFTDIDSNLTYSALNVTNIDITFDGSTATLNPKNSWTGSIKTLFKANDSIVVFSGNEVTLTIKTGNVAPEIRSHFPLGDPRINISDSFNFSIGEFDANNDTVQIQWYLNDASISGATRSSYVFRPENKGSYVLKVVVSDGVLTDSYEWNVFATSFNEESNETLFLRNLCGNNEVDAGEGCETCQLDVICSRDEACIDNKCVLEKRSMKKLLIFLVAGIILASIGVALFIYYKHKKEYGFQEKTINVPTEAIKKDAEKDPGPIPIFEIDDVYPDKRKENLEELKDKKPSKKVADIMLRNYIRNCISKGISIEKIKKTLLDKGWKKEEVELILLEFELKRR